MSRYHFKYIFNDGHEQYCFMRNQGIFCPNNFLLTIENKKYGSFLIIQFPIDS